MVKVATVFITIFLDVMIADRTIVIYFRSDEHVISIPPCAE